MKCIVIEDKGVMKIKGIFNTYEEALIDVMADYSGYNFIHRNFEDYEGIPGTNLRLTFGELCDAEDFEVYILDLQQFEDRGLI